MKRILRKCETCGAPFPAGLARREIVCQYCGSVYFDDEFIEPKEDPVPTNSQTITQYNPKVQDGKLVEDNFKGARSNRIVLLVVVTVIVSMTFLFFALSDYSSLNADTSATIPDMLSKLPTGEYAGKKIPFSNWELTVSPEINVQNSSIGIRLALMNWGDSEQLFRFRPNSFTLYDDLGNSYPIRFGNCSEDSAYFVKQVSFNAFELKEFSSAEFWCKDETYLPVFFGTIPMNAKQLYLQMTDFGVFSKITFVIDL
jgi:hypothetical protein